jgi:uncharacterized protein YhbP (UPF0306 family)
MEKNELKRIILQYLENHNTVSLATEKEGLPHAATVFYVNIGFELFFLSSPASRHAQNFLHNHQVSATINEDYSNWLLIKGIQGILKNRGIAKTYVEKFPDVADFIFSPKKLAQAIAKKVAKVEFYKLMPSKIYFINNELGFGHRDELILNGSWT